MGDEQKPSVNVETWLEPGTGDAMVRMTYRIPAFLIISRQPYRGLKNAFMTVFRDYHRITEEFVRRLIYSERGFGRKNFTVKEKRLPGREIVETDYIEAEVVDEGS